MANAFRIMDSSNVIITYTDYDDIPLATLKHVISFIPDLGTEEQSNEILLEVNTLNSGATDKFVEEATLSDGDNIVLDGTSSEYISLEDATVIISLTVNGHIVIEQGGNIISENSVVVVGDNLIMENAEGRDKLVPENFAEGEENHLVLELIDGDITFGPFVKLETGTTDVLLYEDSGKIIFDNIVGDAVGADHFHPPVGEHHVDGDGHTEEEHREINLWQHKLQLLITQESINASSL